MSDLIINGIDHGKFYIEWAKRGGVVKTSVSEQPAMAKCLGVKQDGRALFVFFIDECENERLHYGFVYPKDQDSLRMATPDECAEAGVDYIEPPARWLPIESAPKNKLVLLYRKTVENDLIYLGGYQDGEWCTENGKVTNEPHYWMPLKLPNALAQAEAQNEN